MENSVYDLSVLKSDGQALKLDSFRGKALLIVNVASKCGFTPQYDGLEALHKKYAERGLVILGFPCNQFGGQEPGTENEIQNFCRATYGVDFPVLAKVEVNGEQASPLYKFLKAKAPGLLGIEAIKWNFTKFLIDREGAVERFAPMTDPSKLEPQIEKVLAVNK